ncbi:hypothetical protein NQ314_015588 [Rhamnusium bicolor]|uniref:WD repeat-containing protein 6 n=1 Tax=Rhamnusium bicolor TaxID=1586634 RepID=A0AAV8WZ45_9CUCU|nr:hypothetical protein NQ314_015588 [Rhamnusium bicolor]
MRFHGQVYIYKEENGTLQQICFFEHKNKSRILSLHWLNCRTLLTCQTEGKITLYYLKNDNIFPISYYTLPVCKERWTTTALFVKDNNFVVGDRKGNLHLFEFGKVEAVQSVKKVHNYLGVTNLIIDDEKIKSLGRNGSIKTFLFNKTLQLISSDKLPFTWLVNIIDDLLMAFSGNNFIIWNHKTKRIVFEKSCGGGHRSWDLFKNNNQITFSYIKNKLINTIHFQLNDFLPVDLIEGYQVKEINSVKIIKIFHDYIIISGGEDTSLRINLFNSNNFKNLITLKSQLSSIRTITMVEISKESDKNKMYLVFSAGGRAQIICWKLQLFTEDNYFKNLVCSEQHSYYKIINSDESEMRIMDLALTNIQDKLILFCACSDGNIKVFHVADNVGRYHLIFCRDIFYKLKCILKLCIVSIFSHNILLTMATDGNLVFWDVTNIFKDVKEIKPFHFIRGTSIWYN